MAVADVYGLLASLHSMERRYRVDAEILEEYRRAAKAAQAVEGTTWAWVTPRHFGSVRC